jgi:L-Ala-D/L-Glu epimerase
MRIQSVSSWKERLPLKRPYTIATQHVDGVDNLFVRIRAQNGAIGVGVAAPAANVTGESAQACEGALDAHLAPLLDGADLRHFRSLLRQLGTAMAGAPAACAAVDIALHDLLANCLGLPLIDVLGRVHESLPTSITIGICPVDETLAQADDFLARGFSVLKIKTGLHVDEDIERLVKLRERFGAAVDIRVDANQGYNRSTYTHFLAQTKTLNLEFVEQPLPAADLAGMRGLPASVRRNTAADETLLGPRSALACLAPPRPFGIFNIKLMKCGGIATGLRIADLAHDAGIDLMWGCMDESVIGIAGALHAALASPATRYLDLDGSFDLARDVAAGGFVVDKGRIRTLDGPGLGVKMI